MVSSRLVKRGCSIVALTIGLIYILQLTVGPLQKQCKCDESDNSPDSAPVESRAKEKDSGHFLCLIVPYRERFEELSEFIPQMTAFLQRNHVPHYIFIINQEWFPKFLNWLAHYLYVWFQGSVKVFGWKNYLMGC